MSSGNVLSRTLPHDVEQLEVGGTRSACARGRAATPRIAARPMVLRVGRNRVWSSIVSDCNLYHSVQLAMVCLQRFVGQGKIERDDATKARKESRTPSEGPNTGYWCSLP